MLEEFRGVIVPLLEAILAPVPGLTGSRSQRLRQPGRRRLFGRRLSRPASLNQVPGERKGKGDSKVSVASPLGA